MSLIFWNKYCLLEDITFTTSVLTFFVYISCVQYKSDVFYEVFVYFLLNAENTIFSKWFNCTLFICLFVFIALRFLINTSTNQQLFIFYDDSNSVDKKKDKQICLWLYSLPYTKSQFLFFISYVVNLIPLYIKT